MSGRDGFPPPIPSRMCEEQAELGEALMAASQCTASKSAASSLHITAVTQHITAVTQHTHHSTVEYKITAQYNTR